MEKSYRPGNVYWVFVYHLKRSLNESGDAPVFIRPEFDKKKNPRIL